MNKIALLFAFGLVACASPVADDSNKVDDKPTMIAGAGGSAAGAGGAGGSTVEPQDSYKIAQLVGADEPEQPDNPTKIDLGDVPVSTRIAVAYCASAIITGSTPTHCEFGLDPEFATVCDKGFTILWHCPRCGDALQDGKVVGNIGIQPNTEDSVFEIHRPAPAALLACTMNAAGDGFSVGPAVAAE